MRVERELVAGLLQCHSTPGDEGEVADFLARVWVEAGWEVARHGRYAISARRPGSTSAGRARLLVTAHMDSPGYIVERVSKHVAGAVPLGGVAFSGDAAAAIVKGAAGKAPVTIRRSNDGDRVQFALPGDGFEVCPGDRLCFSPETGLSDTNTITAPFLDNRLGCALLCEIARALPTSGMAFDVVLGATAAEEFGGFGAPVLARAVEPDVVICLDATYEAPEQEVCLGRGPVLTLSDNSVLLSPGARDGMRAWFAKQGLPLQTEVYNYSGTDARAFPRHGLPAPVFALLIPSRNNHSPAEVADLADYATLREALLRFAADPPPV